MHPWISKIVYCLRETIQQLVLRLTDKRLNRGTIALKTQWLKTKGLKKKKSKTKGCSLFNFNVNFLVVVVQDSAYKSGPLEAQSSNE